MVVRTFLILILSLAVRQLQAQICSGSLGDPIVNITFGSGANPGAPLHSGVTTYQYFSNDCPQDGLYTIRNSTASCHGNTWHSLTDHTGDANGYFMLINASMQPSVFYIDTVGGLCGNTTYEFAAWVANVLKQTACGGAGIKPNLTFRIERKDGTVLQVYHTGDIADGATPQWRQFGFFFTTPPGASEVVLRIINNSQGGCGNDLALDDITFRPCGPKISTSITGSTATSVSVCEGTAASYTFNANVSAGFNSPVMQWQESINASNWSDITGATTATLTRNFAATAPAGNRWYRVVAAESGSLSTVQCRVASLPLQVTIQANGLAAASNNGPVCEGKSFNLSASGGTLSWSGPNGFVASGSQVTVNNASLPMSGTYYVQAMNGGCSRSDSTFLVVHPNPVISASVDTVNICQGDSIPVWVMGATSFNWTPSTEILPGDAATLVFPSDSTIYQVVGTGANGCSDSLEIVVNVFSRPRAEAGPDLSIMEGASVRLRGRATGDSTRFYWTPDIYISDPDTLAPLVNPVNDIKYYFNVVSLAGCGLATDSLRVHVYKKIQPPNVFSPNGDGINDRWMIAGLGSYDQADVLVFDRYGRRVFRSKAFNGWDGTNAGKPLPVGTYYYLLRLGAGFTPVTGWVLLLR